MLSKSHSTSYPFKWLIGWLDIKIQECNILILIRQLMCTSVHRIKSTKCTSCKKSALWNRFHNHRVNFRNVSPSTSYKDTEFNHIERLCFSPRCQDQPSIREWGLLGSAGSDLIGRRCCCCGDELCRTAPGSGIAGAFPGGMEHGMRWRQ